MPQHPLFDITPEHILAVDDEGLRLLIARLCKADLRRRCLPVSAVLYGGNQIAADGGIDVRVELPADTEISGFIPRPATGFQAKADDMPASEIAKEMRPAKTTRGKGTKAPLRPSICALAAAGGAYVIVSSKGSTTPLRVSERRAAMRAAVADLDGSDALHLDVYDRTCMADWVGDFPGEVLWVRERISQPLSGWRPFGNWSRAPEHADSAYLSDDTARLWDQRNPQDGPLKIGDGIGRLRAILSRPGGIVRLTGLSGTGKTRLLEALFDPQNGDKALDPAQAVYADIGAETPAPSVGQLAHRLIAEGTRAVLLLDNCPRETHDAIAPVCRSAGSPISLITVDLDIRDESPEHTDVFRLQNASAAVIESLLERRYPKLSQAIRRRIAEFADGNARIAILSAGNVRPGTNLADLGDERLFERLFQQRRQAAAPLLQAAEALALVYSFDGEATTGDGAELPFLAQLSGLEVRALQRAAGATKRGTEKGDRPHFLQRCPKVSGETWSVPVFRFLLVFFSSGNSTLVCSHCRLWTCPEAHPMDRARLQAESASGSTAGPITTPFFSASFARYIRASVDCRPFLKGGLGEWATSAPTGCPPTHHTPLPITGLSESPADENGAVVIGAGA